MNNPYIAPTADLTLAESDAGTYQPRLFALSGRIGRLRYLAYSSLLSFLAMIPMFIGIFMMAMAKSAFSYAILVLFVPLIAVYVLMATRRLEDVGHSRWWAALMLIPYLSVIPALYLLFKKGDEEANDYGPPPCANSRGVVAGAFAPVVFSMVIGVLSAIAIPAYQTYIQKAGAAHSAGSKL